MVPENNEQSKLNTLYLEGYVLNVPEEKKD